MKYFYIYGMVICVVIQTWTPPTTSSLISVVNTISLMGRMQLYHSVVTVTTTYLNLLLQFVP